MLDLNSKYKMTVNGGLATTENTLPVYNPATKEIIAHVPNCCEEQLNAAVAGANKAFTTWSRTNWEIREQAVSKLADALEEHAEGWFVPVTFLKNQS